MSSVGRDVCGCPTMRCMKCPSPKTEAEMNCDKCSKYAVIPNGPNHCPKATCQKTDPPANVPTVRSNARFSYGLATLHLRVSVGRSTVCLVTFLNCERFLHYCSCPSICAWIAIYPALFFLLIFLAIQTSCHLCS